MTSDYEAQIPADTVMTLEEGIALKERTATLEDASRWRWMGNYADAVTAAAVANQNPPQGAGEAVFSVNNSGQIATWLFF
ncbi:hypothetical protein AB0L74_21500 [Streptomyces sp. NPDC052020]|uniref:hypothetical protein n=1 Tax=Streptomyces sp. NPDC052020 TaxID=3155677 RepID=UPI00341B29BD